MEPRYFSVFIRHGVDEDLKRGVRGTVEHSVLPLKVFGPLMLNDLKDEPPSGWGFDFWEPVGAIQITKEDFEFAIEQTLHYAVSSEMTLTRMFQTPLLQRTGWKLPDDIDLNDPDPDQREMYEAMAAMEYAERNYWLEKAKK